MHEHSCVSRALLYEVLKSTAILDLKLRWVVRQDMRQPNALLWLFWLFNDDCVWRLTVGVSLYYFTLGLEEIAID